MEMKAAGIDAYGPPEVLRVRSTPRPVPQSGQLLIEAHASSVNPIDWKIRGGMLKLLPGFKLPMILGFDVSGLVVEVGSAVKRFKIGDSVYARSDSQTGRAYAEYVAVGEDAAALKPARMSHEEAAAVPLAALTALQALRDQGKIREGSRVLIIGASGGVGIYAVQIAKAMGAHVRAVCGAANMELIRGLGADEVVDYKKGGVLDVPRPCDIVLDAVATQTYSAAKKILAENGAYISTLPSLGLAFAWIMTRCIPGRKAHFILMKPLGRDLEFLTELIEAGKLKSVIDSAFPLDDIVQAHVRSEAGHARGKIVIRIKQAPHQI
jgi:NADPH:quinone reductase-like Zn-dependent oxidoreductase